MGLRDMLELGERASAGESEDEDEDKGTPGRRRSGCWVSAFMATTTSRERWGLYDGQDRTGQARQDRAGQGRRWLDR